MYLGGEEFVSPTNLSKKTLERATILNKNAKSIGISLGDAKFPNVGDLITFFITNGEETVVLYVFPEGYLVELYVDVNHDSYDVSFFAIKNIRHFLIYLNKHGYESWEEYHKDDIIDVIESGEIDLEDLMEEDFEI